MCAGGTSRKSTWTRAAPAGEGQPEPFVSTTCRDMVVPGGPASKGIAQEPCPVSIGPPVSVHAYEDPASSGTLAGIETAPTAAQFATVIAGWAGDASTVVLTDAVLLDPLMSVTTDPTVAVFV